MQKEGLETKKSNKILIIIGIFLLLFLVMGYFVNRWYSGSGGKDSFPTDYIAYWKFESGAEDETGNHPGTLMHDAHIAYDSQKGNVLKTDGIEDHVLIGAIDETENLEELTVSAWVKAAVADDTVSRYVLFKNLNMHLSRSFTGRYYFYVYNESDVALKSTALSRKDREWHHVVGVYNGAEVYIYIDMNKSNPGLNSLTGDTRETPGEFMISYSTSISFNGSIDDVMIFDRALSEGEIQQIYNTQKPAP